MLLKRTSVGVAHKDFAAQAAKLGARPERTRVILNGYDETVFYLSGRRGRRAGPAGLGLRCRSGALYRLPHPDQRGWASCGRPLHRWRKTGRGSSWCAADRDRWPEHWAARARQSSLERRLILPGRLSAPEVRNWMVAAGVFCLPSYSEGCPNVIVEARACGRAVVATSVGGIPELVDQRNGILVPARVAFADPLPKPPAVKHQVDCRLRFRRGARLLVEVSIHRLGELKIVGDGSVDVSGSQ